MHKYIHIDNSQYENNITYNCYSIVHLIKLEIISANVSFTSRRNME